MNAADRLKDFLERIDVYVQAKNINPTPFSLEFALAETLDLEKLEKLTSDECFNYAYLLYQYADNIGKERANCENIVRWCISNLDTIIAFEIDQFADIIAKHEIKVAKIIRGNELASKINDWKITAEGRLENVKNREYNIRRKADILIEKGKRK